MTSTASPTPLLDGPRGGIVAGIVMLVLVLIAVDGLLTWVDARDADDAIETVIASDPDRYPTGIDDHGQLLSPQHRDQIAANTDGDRLDRDLITTKSWLAVIGLIAAVALTIASGPGSSRNFLAGMILLAAAAFFVPLTLHADTIDIVTTAHGG